MKYLANAQKKRVDLLQAYLGAELTIAQLRRQLRDREKRLRYIATKLYKGGSQDNSIYRATELRFRSWE